MSTIKARDAIIKITLDGESVARYVGAIKNAELSLSETYGTDRVYIPKLQSSFAFETKLDITWWNTLFFGMNYGMFPTLERHEITKRKIRKYLVKRMKEDMKRERVHSRRKDETADRQ